MAYGKPKITSADIKQEILTEVSAAIDRNSDFGSENLSFYGYFCQFELNIGLQARGPEAASHIIGQAQRNQTLEPGETPPLSRREYIEQWLTNMEAGEKEIDVDTITEFLEHLPVDENPVAVTTKVKGKKTRGEAKNKAV